jgi:glycosyltransferase involved in cell wall biosynthesis
LKNRKKVLFILPTLHSGGTENYALRFCKYYQYEIDFYVISLYPHKGDLHTKFEELGVKLKYLSIGYLNPLKSVTYYQFLKRNNFDSVCAFNGTFAGIPIFISKFAGIEKRIVFYRRSSPAFNPNFFNKIYFYFAGILVRKFATSILSNSKAAFSNLFPNNVNLSNRFKVILNGVDPQLIHSSKTKDECRLRFKIPKDSFVVGHVGRYDPAKNHKFIFSCAQKLLSREKKYLFVFCGKDTDSEEFKSEITKFGLIENCLCLGLREDLEDVYKVFDIFFFPSVTEGQPNALIEAMLAGLPILASDIEPIKETVPVDFIPKLFPITDEDFVCKMVMKLKNNPELRSGFTLRDFAVLRFNPESRFVEFKHELV